MQGLALTTTIEPHAFENPGNDTKIFMYHMYMYRNFVHNLCSQYYPNNVIATILSLLIVVSMHHNNNNYVQCNGRKLVV